MKNDKISKINDCLEKALTGNLHSNLFYSASWLEVLQSEYNYDFFKVTIPGRDEFLVVAAIEQFGFSKVKALPFCDYIIPSVRDARGLQKLVDKLYKHFKDRPVILKMVLPDNVQAEELNVTLKHTAYRHTVATSSSLDDIQNNMDSSFMRGVKKAKSHSLTVSIADNRQALQNFYEMYCRQRVQKFGKLPQPFSFFEKIGTTFINSGNGFILQARKDDTVIAGLFILAHGQKLYYKFGSSHPDYLQYRPNNMLFFSLFEYAHKNDYHSVDLGLSGVSENYEGLVRFKEYMGGIADNIYTVRLNPPGYNPHPEKQLAQFTTSMTEAIIKQNPDTKTANGYSQILYPYFA